MAEWAFKHHGGSMPFLKQMKFVLVLFICCWAGAGAAELRIDITGAQSAPTPVAIPFFSAATPELQDVANRLSDVIAQDLERSGLFRLVNRDAYIQHFPSLAARPQFQDWQAVNAHALVQGQVDADADGNLVVSYRLWDVFAQTQMEANLLTATAGSWRKLAHIVADKVYERMTGEAGYFDTKIAFVSERGGRNKKARRLAVMDQDGENVRFLTDGAFDVLTPRFSPNMRELVYFSYKDGRPHVYVMELQSGESRLVGDFEGMTFAARFSPDGKKLALSLAVRGNSEIYLYHLATGERKRLTDHPAIDTSPSFSPDGKSIAFNSDRSGRQQLYVMDADGGNARRISFGDGAYATPVWSPRGDYIAFTKIKDDLFYIGVMRPDGSAERLVASGFLVESPTWAPNGRILSFVKQTPADRRGRGGTSRIYTIDITGHNERVIQTPDEATDPAWSPQGRL